MDGGKIAVFGAQGRCFIQAASRHPDDSGTFAGERSANSLSYAAACAGNDNDFFVEPFHQDGRGYCSKNCWSVQRENELIWYGR